jgi:hypothetical protein
MEDARRWYDSADYRELKALRSSATALKRFSWKAHRQGAESASNNALVPGLSVTSARDFNHIPLIRPRLDCPVVVVPG